MKYNNLIIKIEDSIAWVTINRPEKLNALNQETIQELSDCFSTIESDNAVRVVIISGQGAKSFVAGADIKEFSSYTILQAKEMTQNGHDNLMNKIENLSKPVIAAINGFALGGGLEMALACHIRIASENAKLGLPEVTLGLIPGYGGTQRLSKIIGKGRAFQAICTAEAFNASKALEIGLVNEVLPQEKLLERAKEIATKITTNSAIAIKAAIKSINASDSSNGFDVEISEFCQLFSTSDFQEGVSAFLEKRKAQF